MQIRQLGKEYWSSVSIKDWNFTVVLKNDTRESQNFVFQSVYANQQPVPFSKEFSLNARDSLMLDFADVLRDYGYEKEQVLFGKLIIKES